jgi:hypothetical protein
VLILEALQPAPRYVVLAWRRGLVPLWFSRRPFSHLVVFPGRIQWVQQWERMFREDSEVDGCCLNFDVAVLQR